MSLSAAIIEHNEWFHSRQDEYYKWFLEGGHEAMTSMLADLSGRSDDAPIEVPSHSKYILDNGKYAFLLVGVNGEAEKLSPAYVLCDESANLGEDEAIPSAMINTGAGMETVRYIPADSSYEFPLRDETSGETSINGVFLEMVDAVYEPFFTESFPTVEGELDEQKNELSKTYKDLMSGYLAKYIVSNYHGIPWDELAEECGVVKEAYEWFVQQTFSNLTQAAFKNAKEDMIAMVQDDDPESE
jgi:hypothetical protein